MLGSSTDREWEKFGKNDPYFGVLADEKFRKSKISNELKEKFFQSGDVYIQEILENIRTHIETDFTIDTAIDFGCGVGRLVIPLAGCARSVTGIDVSQSMLDEAKRNCDARSISNVNFVKSDDNLSSLEGSFNFIHSFIVFQHIAPNRGELIFKKLISHLSEGGICVVHFTYASVDETKHKRLKSFLKKWIPFLGNLVKGRDFFTPHMQMNDYNLNRLFSNVQSTGTKSCFSEFTNHGGYLGMTMYFQKPKV
jgi:cyclopropane fatty-acyl-phospholipid synthase-like methyltransferase